MTESLHESMHEPLHEPLAGSLAVALRDIANTDRLLVALDFDGTLAPEVDDPERARAIPEAQAAVLRLLDAAGTRVALVSGRSLENLERVAGLPDSVLLVGSHGVEYRLDAPEAQLALAESEQTRLAELRSLLADVAATADGAWVELKPVGAALHTRLASDAAGRAAQELTLQRTVAELPGLTMRRGKNVLEFSVRTATKGEAVDRLRDYTAATAIFYAGDDVTDEDAFAALGAGDLALKSGPGETVAGFRVADPAAVAAVLHELARLREARTRS